MPCNFILQHSTRLAVNKIKFNCPSCQARLKVPAKLAGVAGPCPQCGGVIVAPLQSTAAPQPEAEPVLAGASASVGSAAASLESQPASRSASGPPESVKPALDAHSAAPAQEGFPKPLEQVSPTARVALSKAPVPDREQPHQPGPVEPGPPVAQVMPPPPDAASTALPPETPSPAVIDLAAKAAAASQFQEEAEADKNDLDDIFKDDPVSQEEKTASGDGDFQAMPPVSGKADQSSTVKAVDGEEGAYQEAVAPVTPKTQPIVVKSNDPSELPHLRLEPEEQRRESALPRLDVSLGENSPETLSTAGPGAAVAPTHIQLPSVGGAENGSEQISISQVSPQSGSDSENGSQRPAYRPPEPVALRPPQEKVQVESNLPGQGPVQMDTGQPMIPETPYLSETGEGTVGAFLGGNLEPEPAQNFPDQAPVFAEGPPERSKDEILEELLGMAPAKKKRKKGVSNGTWVMLTVFTIVILSVAAGVYLALDKMGGFDVSKKSVFGEQGLKNLDKKAGLESYTVPAGNADPNAVSVDTAPQPREVRPMDTQGSDNQGPDQLDDELLKEVVNSPELENNVGVMTNIGEEPPKAGQSVEPDPVDASPVAPIQAVPTQAPAVQSAKEDYNPPPFFAAPGPDDPPLMNTHELVDAFMRAPSWKERIPYIYQGESLKPAIEEYYKKWPDFSFDRFKRKLFQMELDEEFGGPFWVYQVAANDADPAGVPMIIRVENGHLKVDWEIFSEFIDQHFVKFRHGEITAPHTFRIVAERVSEYPGSDKPGFTDVDDYLCFELNPPYGGYRAFSKYAFVKKGTALAEQLGSRIKLAEDPLAVILTLDRKDFSHGIKHLVVTKFVNEGWFR